VRAVGGTEGVVDEEILAHHQLLGEGQVAGFLPRVEPQVLEQLHPVAVGAGGRQQLVQTLADRRHVEGRIRVAFGPPQVAGGGHLGGPLIEQPGQGLQRQPDPQVIGDPAGGHRDVEISPHQDVLALDRRQVLEDGDIFFHE
jgi:hypothetical protein